MAKKGVSRRDFLKSSAMGGVGAVLAYGLSPTWVVAAKADKTLRVAEILVGTPEDKGWNFEQFRGLQYIKEQLGDKVETFSVENVAEVDAERVMRDLASQGYDLILSTSFGFMDATVAAAAAFPETKFVHNSGYKTAKNLSTVFAKMQEVRYLTGLVAGKMTKTNIIGCAASFPLPLVILELNAFALGVQAVNPGAVVKVVWTQTWFDPPKEREAAEALVTAGADVLCKYQDSPTVEQVAEEHGIYSIGFHSDTSFVGKSVLTSARWHWGPVYERIAESVRDGTFASESYWGGMKDGVVELGPYSPLVPKDVQDLVGKWQQKIVAGWNPMTGPLSDQAGKLRVKDGVSMTDQDMQAIDWFVKGVEATLPKK